MRKKLVSLAPAIVWAIAVFCSYLWNSGTIERETDQIIKHIGRTFFAEIQTTRLWNAMHGGVYVPITETTQPNQYLETPERDLETRNGINLTMINPAFMTRQLSDISKQKSNVQYHITSLNPIRPANEADPWEYQALKLFEDGESEYFERILPEDLYRYMAPLYVKFECMQCHAKQGYEVGDIRGGISISLPSELHQRNIESMKSNLIFFHVLALVIGLAVFYYFNRFQAREITLQEEKNKVLATQATKDFLTGSYNRQFFNKRLEIESNRSERHNIPLSII